MRISPQPDSMPTSRNHDTSGGPVYTVRSDGKVAAKGIINGAGGGGSDFYGGALDPCIMWFTDIYQPYYGFPGTLVTS